MLMHCRDFFGEQIFSARPMKNPVFPASKSPKGVPTLIRVVSTVDGSEIPSDHILDVQNPVNNGR